MKEKKRIKTFENFINEDSYFHNTDQIDEILDKISSSGYKSLSNSDRAILFNYSKDDEDIHKVLVEANKLIAQFKELNKKMSVLTGADPKELVDKLKSQWVQLNSKLSECEGILRYLYKLEDPGKIYNYNKKHGLAMEKINHSNMINEYKYVNKFDFELGKSYEYDELPQKTKDDIDVQFDDNAEYGPDDYNYIFKLLTPKEIEEHFNDFGEYNIADTINDPNMKLLIKKVLRVGLDYPAVGVEGDHKALACYTLNIPLPYLEMQLKPEENDN